MFPEIIQREPILVHKRNLIQSRLLVGQDSMLNRPCGYKTVGVSNCYMFCCTLLYVHCSIAIILMGKRGLVALLNLSSWCLVMDERLFLSVPWGCLRFVIEVFPDHTHLLFLFSLSCSTKLSTKFQLLIKT